MSERECDRNNCYDVMGFPEDTQMTFYSPDMWGDWRPTTWPISKVLEIIYSYQILLKGPTTDEYAMITDMVSTEHTEPVNPVVYEIHMANGKSWLCAEEHKVLSIYDRTSLYSGLMSPQYCTQNGGVVNRTKRVKQYKYKAKYWMHVITKDDVPFIINDTDILHTSSRQSL